MKSKFTKHFSVYYQLSTWPRKRKSLFHFVSFFCDFPVSQGGHLLFVEYNYSIFDLLK